jgi:serine/threonine protein kinase
MTSGHDDLLEELLAEALALYDTGGEPALAAFVARHPQQAPALARGLLRCREMGLLGTANDQRPASHPEQLGDYRLVRRIGGGGMGVVYEAIQEPLGRRVALKVVRPELLFFEGARERFRREIDAIAKLEHPAIVSVFTAGEHEGVPFFAMELIEGMTLDQVTTQMKGRDPGKLRAADLGALLATGDATTELYSGSWWEAAVRIGLQLAHGLRHAHLRGIVHRDIKPSNGIVTAHGRVVVLDFGIAQVRASSDLTRSGATPGSPAFMSPEQSAGQATDERTDVFSLAATLWQLLTLQRPFRDAEQARRADQLPPLRQQCRSAPSELDLVLRTAMDPERDRRYADMAAFAADLQAVLERRPIAARPLSLGLRLLRWSQRHRTTAAALVVAGLAGAISITVLYFVQSSASRALAVEQARTRDSLDTSLEALRSILVRLGNEDLRAVPQAEPIAHGVLVDAAGLFRTLLERHPGDEKVQVNAGRALHALAMSFERRGDFANAVATVEEAIALLGGEQPGSPGLLDVRAHAYATLAGLQIDHRARTKAVAALRCAEADFAAASVVPKLATEALRARAELHTKYSLLHDEQRDPAAVEKDLREAVQLQRECMARGEPDAKDPSLLVMHMTNLGKFLQRQDRRKDARAVLEEALPLAQALSAEGTWPPPAVYTAEVQEALGNVLARDQDPTAESLLRDSVTTRRRAVDDYPKNVEFRVRLAGALHNLGRSVFADNARTEAALELFEEARAIQQEVLTRLPGHQIALDFLGKHLDMIAYCNVRLRRAEPLATTARALGKLPSNDPLRALKVVEFSLKAWQLGGKSDNTLLAEAMAQLLLAEQRGLRFDQLPARGLEPLADQPQFAALRTRLQNAQQARKGG